VRNFFLIFSKKKNKNKRKLLNIIVGDENKNEILAYLQPCPFQLVKYLFVDIGVSPKIFREIEGKCLYDDREGRKISYILDRKPSASVFLFCCSKLQANLVCSLLQLFISRQ
jgi:hypothetical protein